MKTVEVRYFASFREAAGKDDERVQVECASYRDLFIELSERYQFRLPADMVQVAINDEYASLDSEVRDGARVVFIPPVAGG